MRAARTGQTNIGGVDAECLHQVQQLDLFLDGRLADGGRLQAVAQRLVVEADVASGFVQRRIDFVPIVNQFSNRQDCTSATQLRVQTLVLFSDRGNLKVELLTGFDYNNAGASM